MAALDIYVHGREKVLNLITGVNPDSTLNARSVPSQGLSADNYLARDIKDSLNKVLSLALGENGKVDYQKLVRDPHYLSFREFVGGLQSFDYHELSTTEEQLAFWINLYNALVIDAVIQENIQVSVTESWLGILAFFQKAAYHINGTRFSLTDIEHGVLRSNRGFPYFPSPHFGSADARLEAVIQPFDPRIHFALNCASNSCPPIGIYTPESIHDQLDQAARNFINNDLVVNLSQKEVSISKIFQWYQGDFGEGPGITSFLIRYVNDQVVARWLSDNQPAVKIKYHPYDWGLNKIGI